MDSPIETKQTWLLVFGICVSILLAIPAIYSNHYDDTYIHARIARNIIISSVPIFNQGEIFKAGSSTGFVLLISVLGKIIGVLNAIRAIEFFVILSTSFGIFYLIYILGQRLFLNIFVAACILPFFLLAAYGGMETPIVCLLIVWSAVAFLNKKHGLVVLLISFSVWLRFEAFLLLILVIIYYIRIGHWKLYIYLIPFAALIVTDLIFFGTIIPYAAKVKSVAYGYPLIQSLENVITFGIGSKGIFIGLLLVIFFISKSLSLLKNKFILEFHDTFLYLTAGIFIAWIFGRSLTFPWYWCLLTFPFGIAFIISDNEKNVINIFPEKIINTLHILIIASFGFLGLSALIPQLEISSVDATHVRVVRYLDIGAGLYAQCPTCSLVTSEIGGLGYSFEGRVYDAFGLGDPAAEKFHPMKVPEERRSYSVGAIPPKYIEFRDPDFIVSMTIFSQAFRSSSLLEKYFSYDCPLGLDKQIYLWDDDKIQVYSKNEISPRYLFLMHCKKSN